MPAVVENNEDAHQETSRYDGQEKSQAAFDAHPSLLMEDGSPLPPAEPEAVEAAPLPEAAPAAEHEIPDAEHAASTAARAERETPDAAPSVDHGAAAEPPRGIAQREAGVDLDSIILIDPDIPPPEDLGPLPQIYPAPSTYPPEPATPAESSVRVAAVAPIPPTARIEYATPQPSSARVPPAPRRVMPWVWGVASALLLDVREMGRATTGVRGVTLEDDDRVVGMVVIRRDATLLVVTEKGLGKRSELPEYRVQRRGGKGIITLKRTDKTGDIVALKEVLPDDELMMITRHGVIIRVPADGIRVIGRNTQGVKVMNLDAGDTVMDVTRVVKEDENGGEEGSDGEPEILSPGRDQREMDV